MAKQYNWKKEGGDMHNFEENSELIGKYVSKTQANPAARQSSVITLMELDVDGNETGKEIKFWGSTVLDKHFDAYQSGIVVKVNYLGMATSKSGAQYKNFEVSHDEVEEEKAPMIEEEN